MIYDSMYWYWTAISI